MIRERRREKEHKILSLRRSTPELGGVKRSGEIGTLQGIPPAFSFLSCRASNHRCDVSGRFIHEGLISRVGVGVKVNT